MKVIALTGGIGTGKSTVGKLLQAQNIPVINADQLSREVCKAGSIANSEIAAIAGDDVLLPSGELNRSKLKDLIFSDENLRKKIEAIIHPKIKQEFQKKIDELRRKNKDIVFYEIPLLFETNSEHNFDSVVCVDAPDEIRIERIIKQRKYSEEQVKKIMSSQKTQGKKRQLSDYVINNGASLESTEEQVLELIEKIQSAD